ncbi:MAG: iron oxidase [Candidimonas sp.]|nr:MAG: iron oxidase [Candidimonas sp.]TAM23929.1 MAG: iron oxidase [Candidimonas sp.]
MKNKDSEFDTSRRNLLKNGATITAIGAVVATGLLKSAPARAQAAKASKATMMYQATPHGKDQCDNCVHFIPGKTPTVDGTCTVVEGSIAPGAWCVAYAPKG